MVYISILEQQAKYGDALEVLTGKLGSLLTVEVDRLRIQVFSKAFFINLKQQNYMRTWRNELSPSHLFSSKISYFHDFRSLYQLTESVVALPKKTQSVVDEGLNQLFSLPKKVFCMTISSIQFSQ